MISDPVRCSIEEIDTGTWAVIFYGGRTLYLTQVQSYEVSGDGDLILISMQGRVVSIPPAHWFAIGTVERRLEFAYVLIERTQSYDRKRTRKGLSSHG